MIKMPFRQIGMDRTICILGILGSLLIIAFGFLTKPIYGILGILCLAIFIGWLFWGKKVILGRQGSDSKTICKVTIILFFILFAISVLIIRFRLDESVMPLDFFYVFAAMAGVVFIGAMTSPKKMSLAILLEIIMLGALYVVSEATMFPSVLGVDPWFHQVFTNEIISSGQIPVGSTYSLIPLFQVFVAQLAIVFGTDYKTASVIAGVFIVMTSALLVYSFGHMIFGGWKIGLVCALTIVTAESILRFGIALIPTSTAGVLFFAIIFMLMNTKLRKTPNGTLVVILLMFSLVLMHSVTSVSLAMILILAYVTSVFFNRFSIRKEIPINWTTPLLFLLILAGWWVYASSVYFQSFIDFVVQGFSFEASLGITTPSFVVPFTESLVASLGSYLFFGVGIIGLLYLLSSRNSTKMKVLAIIFVVPVIVAFITSVAGGYYFQDRFWYYGELTMALPFGLALYILAGDRKFNLRTIGATAIVVGIVFLMIICPNANMTNSTFSPNTDSRLALTTSEMSSLYFAHDEFNRSLISDRGIAVAIANLYIGDPDIPLNIVIDKGIDTGNYSSYSTGMILLRNAILTEPFYLDGAVRAHLSYDPGVILEKQGFNLVANNGAVRCYLK